MTYRPRSRRPVAGTVADDDQVSTVRETSQAPTDARSAGASLLNRQCLTSVVSHHRFPMIHSTGG
jgi:hypothetical protein